MREKRRVKRGVEIVDNMWRRKKRKRKRKKKLKRMVGMVWLNVKWKKKK